MIPSPEKTEVYVADDHPNAPVRIFHYQPFEIHINGEPTDLFHYARFVHTTGAVEPVGYCAQGCPGHREPEEAREHFRQFLLDHHLKLHRLANAITGRCAVCGKKTACEALFRFDEETLALCFHFCPEHLTREQVERLFVLADFHLVEWYPDDWESPVGTT